MSRTKYRRGRAPDWLDLDRGYFVMGARHAAGPRRYRELRVSGGQSWLMGLFCCESVCLKPQYAGRVRRQFASFLTASRGQ
jgi:hypothetical protein